MISPLIYNFKTRLHVIYLLESMGSEWLYPLLFHNHRNEQGKIWTKGNFIKRLYSCSPWLKEWEWNFKAPSEWKVFYTEQFWEFPDARRSAKGYIYPVALRTMFYSSREA